ncbi:KR domain-containing protein [Xylaria arbuscula]|nr:KR domain-containing protein [Xylaria arbuscula]
MPVVFATAIHSLIDIARLEKNQSVLIHSRCGGVGLAAIQISRMIGARIFTTVSNEDKVKYLMDNFDIPRSLIFNSRDPSFVTDLMRETNGQGVDVALNSLSGELLHSTWCCIAKFGTMVEIGKRDLFEGGRLDMKRFLANRSYSCVDLYEMCQERLGKVANVLRRMMEFYHQGFIKPVVLAMVYPPSAIVDAMRYMQQGSHIGKIAISIRNEDTGEFKVPSIKPSYADSCMFDPAASYLLVGGLGGFGRSVSVWMAQRGAQYITFMSRHAGDSSEDNDLVRRLKSMGCSVQLVRGSVSNAKDVADAVSGTQNPLKGIVQLSMALCDKSLSHMTIDDWNHATAPKIHGTWNLHEVSQAQSLDLEFFVLLSSLSGIFGQTGQANYAAANTFLDAFVKYRRDMGLPCAAIDVGAIEGVGYLSENVDLLRKMQGMGWRSVTEEEFLEAFEATLRSSSISKVKPICKSSSWTETLSDICNMLLGVVPPGLPGNGGGGGGGTTLRNDIRMAIYHNVNENPGNEGGDDGDDNILKLFLATAKKNPTSFREPEAANVLAREIGKKLFALLLKPEQEPKISLGLAELGLDSMIAVEMRAWWKVELGLTISVLEMLAMGTLLALGEKAATELAVTYEE